MLNGRKKTIAALTRTEGFWRRSAIALTGSIDPRPDLIVIERRQYAEKERLCIQTICTGRKNVESALRLENELIAQVGPAKQDIDSPTVVKNLHLAAVE